MADTKVTVDDVVKARARVDSLRESIANERAKASANATAGENAVRLAQLETEEQRLQGELDALREINKAKNVKNQVSGSADAVRAGFVEGTKPDIEVTADPSTAAPNAPSVVKE